MSVPEIDVERFWKDGFVLLKGVFSPEEIESAREHVSAILREEGRTVGGARICSRDLLSYPELRGFLYDERVVGVVQRILGAPPIYFGDSSFQMGRGARGWHRDNRVSDRFDHIGLDWEGDYPLVRIGIYLQDHAHHSGGLGIRVGSHRPLWLAKPPLPRWIRRRASLLHGRPIHVDTEPGDLVVWTLRTTLPTGLEDRLPAWLSMDDERERAAMFASFASRSDHLDRYIAYLKTRDYMRDLWRNARISDGVREEARRHGLDVLTIEG
jgi:hypothetical protein